ncbi:di-trans,poly-cis-decaprenylcistransferase [Candidatus Woesearchaeota archaeon]|nr:di-trans,poly-cis-decaprenylcistransferase [Candidatus Woesearchaeota archaeon]
MLRRIKSIIRKENYDLKIKVPKHIAITIDGIEKWALKNNADYEEAYKKSFLILKSIVQLQTKIKIPIISFYVLDKNADRQNESYAYLLDSIVNMLDDMAASNLVNENKIKISVLGKWYALPGRVVDSIKNAINKTKDYSNFFVNLCINYDGQEEILDAFKILGMQIKAGKIDPELIDKESIKENLYSSYFLAPELMIKNGNKRETSGFLLWDSINTKIFFSNKLWPDFDNTEFMDAIRDYQKGN